MQMAVTNDCATDHVELFGPRSVAVGTFNFVVLAVVTEHFTVVQVVFPLVIGGVGSTFLESGQKKSTRKSYFLVNWI